MLIFKEFFKTQSDQNIHQNALNCTKLHQIFKFFSGSWHYAPEPIYVRATIIDMFF